MSEDRISLRGLRVRGHHGVYEEERVQGQPFVVDVDLWLDVRAAAESDELHRTVDYDALATRIGDVVAGEPVQLIETLAERVASACLGNPRVTEVLVTVHKPEAPTSVPLSDVSVTVRRLQQ